MATMTRAEMINHTMSMMGVLAAGQSATAEDAALVGKILDSLHSELRRIGLANFATSAFPAWTQESFAMIIAEAAGPRFGKNFAGGRKKGERELRRQMSGRRSGHAIEVDDF